MKLTDLDFYINIFNDYHEKNKIDLFFNYDNYYDNNNFYFKLMCRSKNFGITKTIKESDFFALKLSDFILILKDLSLKVGAVQNEARDS